MTYEIIWDKKVREFLKKTEKRTAQRIIKKVNSIVENPIHFLNTLVDIDAYKLRIGDYRALIELNEASKSINVLYVGHRKNFYKSIDKTK